MMIDPDTVVRVAAWRAEELQREATRYRLASTIFVPRWRRVAGRALLHAGFRMLGARPVPVLVPVPVTETCDC
jgi:hypothetical protein